jgi:hypothetical protein
MKADTGDGFHEALTAARDTPDRMVLIEAVTSPRDVPRRLRAFAKAIRPA